MPALLQICIVIVTIGLLTIALLTVRFMARFFNNAAQDISKLTLAVRESVDQIDLASRETRALVGSLRECVPPIRRVVDRLEIVGQRTADVSSVLLTEIERPVFTAAAVSIGVRSGFAYLLKHVVRRFTQSHTPTNGDHDYE
jgi:hypothetical protein